MGKRFLTNWIATGTNNEYKKVLADIEARIREVSENGAAATEGTAPASLNAGEFYFNYTDSTLYYRATDSGDVNTKTMRVFTYFKISGSYPTSQADSDDRLIFTKITPTRNILIQYIKAWFIKSQNPTFTGLSLDIYAENSDYPTDKLLKASEQTWSDTDMGAGNKTSELWFKYSEFGLKKDESYMLVMKVNNANSFDSDNHISWAMGDPVYTSGLPDNTSLLINGPFRYSVIGRPL